MQKVAGWSNPAWPSNNWITLSTQQGKERDTVLKIQWASSCHILQLLGCGKTLPRGYKTFFVLNSVEHEILNAPKYKNIKKFDLFKAQLSLECYFPAHTC